MFHQLYIRHLLAVVLLSSSTTTYAADELPVVKVASYPCDEKNGPGTLYGSGYAVTDGQETFIITSSHVVIHGDKPHYCHEVQLPRYDLNLKANLFIVNDGKGLALLKLDENAKELKPARLDLIQENMLSDTDATVTRPPSKETVNTKAALIGYRHRNNTKIELWQQNIRSYASEPEILPLVRYFYEVSGETEFGMSGGAVIANEAGPNDLMGILSHHYYTLNEGQAPELATRKSDTGTGEYSNIVIPINVVYEWVESVLLKHQLANQVRLVAAAQEDGRVAIRLGNYKLTESACEAGGVGGQGSGIGGQGSGIGGKDKKPGLCAIAILRMAEAEPLPEPYVDMPGWEAFAAWLEEIKTENNEPAYVTNIEGNKKLHSLGHFLYYVLRTDNVNLETIDKKEYQDRLRQRRSLSRSACRRQERGVSRTVPGGCQDELTKLAWSAASVVPKFGYDAFQTCVTYSVGGKGWRLPTKAELEDLWQKEFADFYLYANINEAYWAEAGLPYAQRKGYRTRGSSEMVTNEILCARDSVHLTDGLSDVVDVMQVLKERGRWRQKSLNHQKMRVICVKDMRPKEEIKWRENEFTYQSGALCNVVDKRLGFKVPKEPFPKGLRNPFPYNPDLSWMKND